MVALSVRHVGGYAVRSMVCGMATGRSTSGMISRYFRTSVDGKFRKRYANKLELVDGLDPYDIPQNEWQGNVNF